MCRAGHTGPTGLTQGQPRGQAVPARPGRCGTALSPLSLNPWVWPAASGETRKVAGKADCRVGVWGLLSSWQRPSRLPGHDVLLCQGCASLFRWEGEPVGEVERQAVRGPQPLHHVSEGSLQGPENRESFNFWEVKGQVPSKVNSVATRRQARIVRPPSQAQPDVFF